MPSEGISVHQDIAMSIAWNQLLACHSGREIVYRTDRGFGMMEVTHKPKPELPGRFNFRIFEKACLESFASHPSLVNYNCFSTQVASEIEFTLARKIITIYRIQITQLEDNKETLEAMLNIDN